MILRHETSPPSPDPARQDFCDYLRSQREERGMSVEDISHVTRIPCRSLRRLEAGRFEDLPGDVFVRGFLRSYARCVELDPDEAIRRYAACGLEPAPVCMEEARALARGGAEADDAKPDEADDAKPDEADDPEADGAEPDEAASGAASAADEAESGAAKAATEAGETGEAKTRRRTFLSPELFPDSGEGRRGHLTVGVIILVIVATLAMSYLMRGPSDAGEGVTVVPIPGDVLARHD